MAGELLPHHVEKATTPAQREACMAIRHTGASGTFDQLHRAWLI
jgi:hypothetical protein